MKRIRRAAMLVVFLSLWALPLAAGSNLSPIEKEWLKKGYRLDSNGWIFLHIEGKPFERGFQRGYLTAAEIDDFFKTIAFVQKFQTAKEIGFFVEAASRLFPGKISEEFVEEMLLMNGFIDVLWHWWPQEVQREKAIVFSCRLGGRASIAPRTFSSPAPA